MHGETVKFRNKSFQNSVGYEVLCHETSMFL